MILDQCTGNGRRNSRITLNMWLSTYTSLDVSMSAFMLQDWEHGFGTSSHNFYIQFQATSKKSVSVCVRVSA
jgi:hypothetical protein